MYSLFITGKDTAPVCFAFCDGFLQSWMLPCDRVTFFF